MDDDNNYNDIPVLYCKRCLSLNIKNVPGMEDSDYCDECGSTHIEKCHIEDWRSLYKMIYGIDYLDSTLK